ncbi:MAG: hypothetical protein DMF74_26130, partial [Acidobacteria bacterium]
FSSLPALSPTGTLTYTPGTDANGSATITVVLKDNGGVLNGGVDTSAPKNFTITVNSVNDAPTFTKGPDQSVNANVGAQTVANWATNISAGPANESGQTLTFNVTGNTNPGLFSAGPAISSSGTLTYTPTANVSGAAMITITLQDNGGTAFGGFDTSGPQSFTISVNCAPTIVTNSNDSGAGSLRGIIASACPGSTITFDMTPGHVTSPITLTTGELLIDKNLTFQGPGANLLTISGNNNSRVFNVTMASPNIVTFADLTIANGMVAGGSSGGGILNNSTATVNVTNSTLSNNTAGFGGGLLNFSTGVVNLSNSTLNNNTATISGGGIYNNGTGTINLTNSTLSGNSGSGGGIFNVQSGPVNVTNSTISGNTAPGLAGAGGGIYNNSGSPVISLRNTIVALNTAGSGLGPDLLGPMTSQGHNLVGKSNNSSGFTNGSNGDIVGTIAAPVNPLLGSLANNGGPTQTMALLPGSPALNAGDNAAIINPPFGGPPFTDQRGVGFNRIVNATVDIGAFESRGFTISATSGTPQSAQILSVFGQPLTATVSSAFAEPVAGGVVTFTAPASGASATFPGNVTTVNMTTNGSGVATTPTLTANGIAGGPYNVVAGMGTGLPTANFALTNLKGDQFITLDAIPNQTFGNPDFNVFTAASSGLIVTLAAIGNCTVSGNTIHLIGAGSCEIVASQGGNENYNAAPDVHRTFSIAKANQTITFGALANKTFGDVDFNVSATASSGLPVSFTATGNCTIAGNTVHLTGAGSCTITASQPGNANFNAATDVPQSFNIAKANQTITFGALANKTFGDPDFNVSATASSGLSVSFTATGNCTIAGNTVHLTGAGSCTITAAQPGNANFNAATNVPQTFTIAKASTITALLASVNPSSFGQSVTFTATVTSGAGTPTGTVQFKDNGTNLGAPVALNAGGVATFITSSLTA